MTTWTTTGFTAEPERANGAMLYGHWENQAGQPTLRPILGWLTQAADTPDSTKVRVIAAVADQGGRVHPVDCEIPGERFVTITGNGPTCPLSGDH